MVVGEIDASEIKSSKNQLISVGTKIFVRICPDLFDRYYREYGRPGDLKELVLELWKKFVQTWF